MPRVKEARDWLLTWSPETDVTEENLPEYICRFMDSGNVSRCYAVLEKADKWHLHIGFSTVRAFNSDYKWWKDGFKEHGFEAPALDIKYHNDIITLIGGYCQKDGNRKMLFSKGITEEQLEFGKSKYIRRQRRQAIRRDLDDYISIPREKYDVALGSYMARTGSTREQAIIGLAQDGFAFASSQKGMERLYEREINRNMSYS